jgi:dephospho-CoA kinase
MKVIGVTGFIGSGKTTVCKELEKLGVFYIDSDLIVHDLYEAGKEGARKIELFFGEDYLKKDGSVNRRKLKKVVFGDIRKLKILNNLIHPLVCAEIERVLKKSDAEICVIEAVYFEKKNLGRFIDKLVWVEGRNVDEKISNLQEKPKHVDFGIENNSSKEELKIKVKKLWQKIMSL